MLISKIVYYKFVDDKSSFKMLNQINMNNTTDDFVATI